MLNFSRRLTLSTCLIATLFYSSSAANAASLGTSATLDLLSIPGNFLENSDGFTVDFDLASFTGNVTLELDEVTATLSEHVGSRVDLEFQIASFYAGLEVPGDVWELSLGYSVEAPLGTDFNGAELSSGSFSAIGKSKVKISEGILDGLGVLGDLADLDIFDTETTLRKSDSAAFAQTRIIEIQKGLLNAIAPDASTGGDPANTLLTYFKQTYNTTQIPEPTSLLLCVFAGIGLVAPRFRSRHKLS